MRPLYLVASGGGLAAAVAAFFGWRRAVETRVAVQAAVGGDPERAREAATQAEVAEKRASDASTPVEVQAARVGVQAAAKKAEEAAAIAAPPAPPEVRRDAERAVAEAGAASTPTEVRAAARKVRDVAERMSKNVTVQVRATGYWPFSATEGERKMEGGVEGAASWNGRRVVDPATGRRVRLRTVEDHLRDGRPFSISGDPEIWPFGQMVRVAWHEGREITGRVVDTGQHFTGARKVYRAVGREPLDLCVASKATKVLTKTSAVVVRGDHWDKAGREVAAAKLRGQTVVGALHMMVGWRGDGIKDGRGYGPYDAGYYVAEDGLECPYGPRGERLSEDYDFRCGPGGYFRGLRPPKKILPCGMSSDSVRALHECGVTAWYETGWYSMDPVADQVGALDMIGMMVPVVITDCFSRSGEG